MGTGCVVGELEDVDPLIARFSSLSVALFESPFLSDMGA